MLIVVDDDDDDDSDDMTIRVGAGAVSRRREGARRAVDGLCDDGCVGGVLAASALSCAGDGDGERVGGCELAEWWLASWLAG